MDIATHLGAGALLAAEFGTPEAQAVCIFAAVAPDIALGPVYARIIWEHKELNFKRIAGHLREKLPKQIFFPYYFTHSFFPVIGFFLLAFFSEENRAIWMAFAIGWLSHLALDIPTHTGIFACRPLFPFFPQWKIQGFGDWWKTGWGRKMIFGSWIFFFVSLVFAWNESIFPMS